MRARSDPSLDRPDVKIQMHTLSAEDPRAPKRLVLDKFPGFGIGSFALRPHSRGSVHLASADPEEPPAIVANYLADPRDRATRIAALRLVRRIADQPALKALIVREVRPGPQAQSDEALLEHIGKLGATSYHPIGTCRMAAIRWRWSTASSGSMGSQDCVWPTPPSCPPWYRPIPTRRPL